MTEEILQLLFDSSKQYLLTDDNIRLIVENEEILSNITTSQWLSISNHTLIRMLCVNFTEETVKKNLRSNQFPVYSAILEQFEKDYIQKVSKENPQRNIQVGAAYTNFGKNFVAIFAMIGLLRKMTEPNDSLTVKDSDYLKTHMHVMFTCSLSSIGNQFYGELKTVLTLLKISESIQEEFLNRVVVTNRKKTFVNLKRITKKQKLENALIVITTPQWLNLNNFFDDNKKRKIPLDHFCFTLIDECDLIACGKFMLPAITQFKRGAILAVSATPNKFIRKMNDRKIPGKMIFAVNNDTDLENRKAYRYMFISETGYDEVAGKQVCGFDKATSEYMSHSKEEISRRAEIGVDNAQRVIVDNVFDGNDLNDKFVEQPVHILIPCPVGQTIGEDRIDNECAELTAKKLLAKGFRVVVLSKALQKSIVAPGVEFLDVVEMQEKFKNSSTYSNWKTPEEAKFAKMSSEEKAQVIAQLEKKKMDFQVELNAVLSQTIKIMEEAMQNNEEPPSRKALELILELKKKRESVEASIAAIVADIQAKLSPVPRTSAQVRALFVKDGVINQSALCHDDRLICILDIRTIVRGVNLPHLAFLINIVPSSSPDSYIQLASRIKRKHGRKKNCWFCMIIEFDHNFSKNVLNIRAFVGNAPEASRYIIETLNAIVETDLRDNLFRDFNQAIESVDEILVEEESLDSVDDFRIVSTASPQSNPIVDLCGESDDDAASENVDALSNVDNDDDAASENEDAEDAEDADSEDSKDAEDEDDDEEDEDEPEPEEEDDEEEEESDDETVADDDDMEEDNDQEEEPEEDDLKNDDGDDDFVPKQLSASQQSASQPTPPRGTKRILSQNPDAVMKRLKRFPMLPISGRKTYVKVVDQNVQNAEDPILEDRSDITARLTTKFADILPSTAEPPINGHIAFALDVQATGVDGFLYTEAVDDELYRNSAYYTPGYYEQIRRDACRFLEESIETARIRSNKEGFLDGEEMYAEAAKVNPQLAVKLIKHYRNDEEHAKRMVLQEWRDRIMTNNNHGCEIFVADVKIQPFDSTWANRVPDGYKFLATRNHTITKKGTVSLRDPFEYRVLPNPRPVLNPQRKLFPLAKKYRLSATEKSATKYRDPDEDVDDKVDSNNDDSDGLDN